MMSKEFSFKKDLSEFVDKISYDKILNIEELVDSYLHSKTWLIRENANSLKTFTGLVGFIAQEVLKRYALFSSRGYDKSQVQAHLLGDIHIHDLAFARFIPYCAGWDIRLLLKKGLIMPNISAAPARHFDTVIDHIVNFLVTAQQEWAGAQAMSYIDLRLAPFVKADSLSLSEVKQGIQRLIFNLNFPSRIACQSPFTNFTFSLDSIKSILKEPAIIGGIELDPLENYLDEAFMIFYAFITNYLKGDTKGRPFTFPIPTILITENFDWKGNRWTLGDIDLSYQIFYLTAKRGTFYFLNCLNEYINPESRFAMCCRLLPDRERIVKICTHQGGIWTFPETTGSIGVVTINLPRIGFLAKGNDDHFFELLEQRLNIARNHLKQKRHFLEEMLTKNYLSLPITKQYLGTLMFHYNTIGIIGMHECLMNLANTPLWEREGIALAKRILSFILSKLQEFESEDNILYNLEQTPAESTSYRLAMIDSILFKKYIEKGEYHVQGNHDAYYYTNSTHIPYNAPIPLHEKIRIEAEFHPYFTGGCVMHIWLYEEPEPEALKRFIYKVFTSTKVAYLTLTPTLTVCLHCGKTWVGIYNKCPECGHEKCLEHYSRIVGYYRPLRLWNKGKVEEFMNRVHYSLTSNEVLIPKNIIKREKP